MRAVILEVDEALLVERRRTGIDRFDEMWEGVLHIVPMPSARDRELVSVLGYRLYDVAHAAGYSIAPTIRVYRADDDYRVPDLAIWSPEAGSERGIEGAPVLVVEIRSPGDETMEKVPWYLGRGSESVIVIDLATLACDLHTAAGSVSPDVNGLVQIPGLPIAIGSASSGAALLFRMPDGTVAALEP